MVVLYLISAKFTIEYIFLYLKLLGDSMTDLTASLLPALQAHRLPGIDLGGNFIYPQYAGQSILNVPSTLTTKLGAPPLGAPPLLPEITDPLGDDIQRVVIILMDALALHRLQRWIGEGKLPFWEGLVQQGILAPLTSITPSTTSAAITTYWTGQPAVRHGITGYEMWMKEYGVVTNMIEHKPITFRGQVGVLGSAGFDPETYLKVPTMGTHLAAHGVNTYGFTHYSIANTGMSRMFAPGVETLTFGTAADFCIGLRQHMESKTAERMLTWAYWSAVDSLSHIFGPDDERPEAEFIHFTQAFEQFFLNPLSAAARKDTLLILTADHGQITTPKNPHYNLENHPNLARRLHINPTGENRIAYLYIRPGQTEAVREYIEHTWPNQFVILESAYALEKGLFGPGEIHPGMPDRIGDLIVIARGDAYLWWTNYENPLLGRHGGLTPEEMLVPFLAVRW
jgi:hypothetical protein